jgi:glyoxylase-like metal-dependent hydrolase (beta-lactamase superfamily II)
MYANRSEPRAVSLSRRTALRGLGGLALGAGAVRLSGRRAAAQAGAPTPPGPHRFAVGSFDLVVVPDGTATFPNPAFPLPVAQILFLDAPEADRDAALREAGLAEWVESPETASGTFPILPLVVDTGEQRVLFDTGYGASVPSGGQLIANLRAAEFAPDDIDVVVLTHLHPDHILGAVDGAGNPAFPNARYVIGAAEHAFWTDAAAVAAAFPDPAARAGVVGPIEAVLPAIETRLELVDDAAEEEIVPGIRAIAAPGHTPGHMAVAIASGNEQVLAVFDAFIHPLHVAHPDWNFIADALPDQTDATRRALLDRVAAEETPVVTYHFPHPGLGRVAKWDDAWVWDPTD